MVAVITPADAFRLLLGARYGKTDLKFADKIDAHWLTYPERLAGRFVSSKERIPRSLIRSANEVIKTLRDCVKAGRIRLRGELDSSKPPIDIDSQDCLRGVLDVFGQRLSIYAHGRHIKAARIYQSVFCVKSDVLKIANEISNKPALKEAPDPIIRYSIAGVYDDADRGGPRPNINELPDAIQPRLKELGYKASGRKIKQIGGGQQFKKRRGKVGVRLNRVK